MTEELKASFKEITGCQDDSIINNIFQLVDNNLERAINNFFSQNYRQKAAIKQESDDVGPSTSQQARLRARKRNQNQLDKDISMINLSDDDDSTSNKKRNKEEPRIRAPIAPIQGAIVQQSFRQAYANGIKRKQTNEIFEQFHNFHDEDDEVEALEPAPFTNSEVNRRIARMRKAVEPEVVEINDDFSPYSAAVSKNGIKAPAGKNLKALFRPPMEIIFKGDWDIARREAQRLSVWLLVNIQMSTEFSCQILNRDLWSNGTVREIIQPNFLFWQVYNDSPDGVRICNYYSKETFPSVFVVDPRNGEEVLTLSTFDPLSFLDQITVFLDKFPNFEARDAFIRNGNGICSTLPIQMAETSSSKHTPNGLKRKLNNTSDFVEEMDIDECANSAFQMKRFKTIEEEKTKNSNDFERVLNKQSSWKFFLEGPLENSKPIKLAMRSPDGGRETISVWTNTTIKVLFLYIAELGLNPTEYLLILDFPKRQFSIKDCDKTLLETGFNAQEMVYIERI